MIDLVVIVIAIVGVVTPSQKVGIMALVLIGMIIVARLVVQGL